MIFSSKVSKQLREKIAVSRNKNTEIPVENINFKSAEKAESFFLK